MSVFFKLDARTKMFFVLLLTSLVFFIDRLPSAVCLLFSFILIRLAAKIHFPGIMAFKTLFLLALFIILIQALFGPGDSSYIVKIFGLFPVKTKGFNLGLVIVCRLFALFILLPVFTETTPPGKIAAGLYSLGFNCRISFIITFVFNLIPLFKEEALSIMDAQKLRGARSFGIRAYAGLLVPLMLGAMKKAQASSAAMDSRAFGVYKTRTWTELPKMQAIDCFFIAGSIIFFVCMILFNNLNRVFI